MSATISSAAVFGLEARLVSVEADIHHGLPKVTIVGLPDTAVQEARERIRSAVKNAGFVFPPHHISLNLSPADVRKGGSGFDFPGALAMLVASGQLPAVPADWMMVGELSLAGDVRPITGVLAIAQLAQELGRTLIVPKQNAREAALFPGAQVIPVRHLRDFTQDLLAQKKFISQPQTRITAPKRTALQTWPHIIGQYQAKRAITIAAAGHHNVLLIGSPGAGKSLLAKATAELLPPMTEKEILTVTAIHSVAGLVQHESGIVQHRPFRQPHHTSSVAALVGGGRIPKPGELSLAHHGVLFLDELPEFSRDHIEALRQPLENGTVAVNRVSGSVTFPAAGMLIAAMNPCPCGFALDPKRTCRCSGHDIRRYQRKVSGPILDRFDVFIHVPRVPVQDILTASPATNDPRQMIARVRSMRDAQPLPIEPEAESTLQTAMERLQLSLRAYHRILRVAQTIARCDQLPIVTPAVIAEALQYRPPALLGHART